MTRFPLIVGIVFIHAYGSSFVFSNSTIGVAQPGQLIIFFQNLISSGIARVAVPLFFLISGYLFFLNFQWSWNNYKNKLFSRLRTLLIPFLFWNLLILLLVSIAQHLPITQSFFPNKTSLTASFSLYDFSNTILGINKFPIAYQFWFIRDLMIMILFVPLLQLILRFSPLFFLLGLLTLWFIPLWPINLPSSNAFFFFYTGAFLASSGMNIFAFDKLGKSILFFYAVFLIGDILTIGQELHGLIHRIGLLFGIFSALLITKFIPSHTTLRAYLLWSAKYSFFIFAVHEPLLTVIQKVSYKFLQPDTDLMVLVLYVSVPIVVICLSVLAYLIAKQISPRFLGLVTGGR